MFSASCYSCWRSVYGCARKSLTRICIHDVTINKIGVKDGLALRFDVSKRSSEMAPVFPVIDVENSSLKAAVDIYSDIDFFKKEKERQKKKRKNRSRERTMSSPLQDSQKLLRKKEYSSELKVRRAKAITKRKDIEQQQLFFTELKANGCNEKERLRQLFSIYAVQHGNSYRKPTKVVRPKFPNLWKPSSHVTKKIRSSSKEVVLPYIGSGSGRVYSGDRK